MPSIGGSKYFVTLYDEYSGFYMVRFLKRKMDARDAVKEMMYEFENLLSSKICNLSLIERTKVKWIRSDGEGEYNEKSFTSWLRAKGIVNDGTTAYSPESNGRAERLNRTMLDI